MNTGIHVGAVVDKTTTDNIAHLIETIFKSGHDNRMDQSTIKLALSTLTQITEVKHITLSNCSITGDKVVQLDSDFNLKKGE